MTQQIRISKTLQVELADYDRLVGVNRDIDAISDTRVLENATRHLNDGLRDTLARARAGLEKHRQEREIDDGLKP